MRFVADENIEAEIVQRLREEGHQVWFVAEIARGIVNGAVLELANQQQAVLLTSDKDFGELLFREKRFSRGVVLLRVPEQRSPMEKAEIVSKAVREYGEQLLGAFAVITPRSTRIRNIE